MKKSVLGAAIAALITLPACAPQVKLNEDQKIEATMMPPDAAYREISARLGEDWAKNPRLFRMGSLCERETPLKPGATLIVNFRMFSEKAIQISENNLGKVLNPLCGMATTNFPIEKPLTEQEKVTFIQALTAMGFKVSHANN